MRGKRLNVSVREAKHQHFQKPNVHLAGVARKLKREVFLEQREESLQRTA